MIRTRRLTLTLISIGVVSLPFFGECTRQSTTFGADKPRHYPTDSVENAAHRAGVVEGFYGPESVRYSPDQDIYFVSVMNGPGSKKDNNGYIVQIDAGQLSKEKLFAVAGKKGVHLDAEGPRDPRRYVVDSGH